MFAERLRRLADRIEGVDAISLVDVDGIPVESVRISGGLDLDALAAELLAQVKAISASQRELSAGAVRQFSVTTDRCTMMVSALTDQYYLLLVLRLGGSVGRARFELRRASLQFEEDLY